MSFTGRLAVGRQLWQQSVIRLPVSGLHAQLSCGSTFMCNPQRAVADKSTKATEYGKKCAYTGSWLVLLSEEASEIMQLSASGSYQ